MVITQMMTVTSKAQDYCQRVGKVSEQSAKVLKKLYPAFSSQAATSKGKRRFDPTDACVVASRDKSFIYCSGLVVSTAL